MHFFKSEYTTAVIMGRSLLTLKVDYYHHNYNL